MSERDEAEKLIAKVLEDDKAMTPAPWLKVQISTVDRDIPPSTYLDAVGIALYRSAAPQLAILLREALDREQAMQEALHECAEPDDITCVSGVRAVYARKLEQRRRAR